jgi:D-3-phosphoglycerate dehydrogenase
MAKVLITPRSFTREQKAAVKILEDAGCELVFNPYGRLLTEEELIEALKEVDGIIVGLDPLSKKVLTEACKLKVISKYGVGVNNIDLEYAKQRNIYVTVTPGTNSSAVAELVIGLTFAVARQIVLSDRQIRNGQWGRFHGFELKGKTMGIIGTGQIGKEVAWRAKGLGMSLICYDVYQDLDWAKNIGTEYVELEELLAASDVITLHLPLTPQTVDLISSKELAMMKPNSVVINTARGGIVNEQALYEALVAHKIAGAGLDVFTVEPPTDTPLAKLENVVMTSHIGAHTQEAVEAMSVLAAENVLSALNGLKPKYTVN